MPYKKPSNPGHKITPAERHVEGLDRFQLARLADWEQRKLAVEDLLFIHAEDGQWAEDVVTKRKDRPRYTIDRISGAIDQIQGDQRQTRTGIKVEPQTDGDEKVAQLLTGLIRSIENVSNANSAYDNAFDEQIISGYGGWRVLHDYENDDSFDQTILIKPINSAASSLYFDPYAEEYDKRDAKWAFLVSAVSREEFSKLWPDATETDFDVDRFKNDNVQHWFGDEGVRIAEYWYRVPFIKKLGLLSDGRTIDLEEEGAVLDELAAKGISVVRERDVGTYKLEMVIMNGAEVLTKPQEWVGKYIPLVPVYGRTAKVDRKHYIRGIVRKAKDSQRIYNYATSAAIEATALTPKDPIWITPHQAKGHETSLRNFPTQNSPFMRYNPDPLAPGTPQRGGAPQLQVALLQQVEQAKMDIQATTGIEPASLGQVPVMKSGKAIEAEQSMGDRGSYLYQSNMEKSKQYMGDIIIDLAPRIFDTDRVIKIMGSDEITEDIRINEEVVDEQTGEVHLVNDLSLGSYSTKVISGPAFSTRRKETVNQLLTLADGSPIVQELALDLIIDNMDLNKGDEIKERVRRYMIKQGTVEPTEEEAEEMGLDQEPPEDPMQKALIENLGMQSEKLIAEIRNKDADTESKIISAQKTSIDALTATVEMILKKLDAGLTPTPTDLDIVGGQQALVEETVGDAIALGEIGGSAPLGRPDASPSPVETSVPAGQGGQI